MSKHKRRPTKEPGIDVRKVMDTLKEAEQASMFKWGVIAFLVVIGTILFFIIWLLLAFNGGLPL